MRILFILLCSLLMSMCFSDFSNSNNQNEFRVEEYGKLVVGKTDQSVKFKSEDCEPQASSVNDDVMKFYDYNFEPFSSYDQTTFFENLYEYSPNNNLGSCGYVSLIQVMSYYDTFYNDDVIPEFYDRHNFNSNTWEDAASISPGVIKNFYSSTSYDSYYQYCHSNSGTDFESALTIAHNVSEDTDTEEKFTFSIGGWDYQETLNTFFNNISPIIIVSYETTIQDAYKNYICDSIDKGKPVIVHIKKFNDVGQETGFHSVVAYDYDNQGIYANFGWGKDSTRQLLLDGLYGYSTITNCYTIEFSNTIHKHSNNYVVGGEGYCGCNISDKVVVKYGGDCINVPPTIYWMRNPLDNNVIFNIKVAFDEKNSEPISTFSTSKNCFTLSMNLWKKIVGSTYKKYVISIERVGNEQTYFPVETKIQLPDLNASATHITIAPAEYNIINTYVLEEEKATIMQGNYKVETSRKRVGYVENQNINLSANRKDAGEAYIRYDMDMEIKRIDVDLSFWSDDEGFYDDSNKSTAFIQYLNSSNQWINLCDMLGEIEMPLNRFNMERFTFIIPEFTKNIRFISTFENPMSTSRNLGRICIGDLSIYFD